MKNALHFLLLVCFITPVGLHAQWQSGLWTEKQANYWYFPNDLGLTFTSGIPQALQDGQMHFEPVPDPNTEDENTEATATISDADGNLLFYTNGMTVWNKNHQIMQNGEGLLGDASSTQGALIIPRPGNPGMYYIFNTGVLGPTYTFDAIKYSEVDMSLDDGLGAVTENKNISLLEPASQSTSDWGNEERLTAVHHSDGSSVWVAMRQESIYYVFKVTQNGIETPPVISNVGDGMGFTPAGVMKFSPDGSKLVVGNPFNFSEVSAVEIFNFNNTTGELTGPVVSIEDSQLTIAGFEEGYGIYGTEFSPNSRFLYVQTFLSNSVYQFDLSLTTEQEILNSSTLLYQNVTPYPGVFYGRPNMFQNANDGKIYMANIEYGNLHVINYPNNAGIACGFDSDTDAGSITLDGGISRQSLPNFITSYFESGILFDGECSGQDIVFSTLRIPGIESIVWDFGDPDSGSANTSTDIQAIHNFSAGGTFNVTAVITSNGAQQTATAQITLFPAPLVTVPDVDLLVKCGDTDGNAIFDLTQFNDVILSNQDSATYTVVYYASEADKEAGNIITAPTEFTTIGQVIFAEVENTATGCKTAISFTLIVNPLPAATNPGTIKQCADNEGNAIFDLTGQDSIILGNQDPGEFIVNYYASEQDVQDNNPIDIPAEFITSGETIYAIVKNSTTGCTTLINFDTVVSDLPSFPEELDYTGCSPFDLAAIAGASGEGLILSYHTTEADAILGSDPITEVTNYILSGNQGTLYIVVQNNEGCQSIGQMNIQPGNCEIPRGISPNNDNMNDNFDLSGFEVAELSIFNRYGLEVYKQDNYSDQWHGQGSNGDELSTGTYYYSIRTRKGEHKTGWVYISREIN